MVKSKILIKGTLDREPRENEDGSVDLILTNVIEDNAPKALRKKGESIFLVRVSPKIWKNNRRIIRKENAEFSVIGGVKASVNKKGMPFVYVQADYVLVNKHRQKIDTTTKELNQKIDRIKNKVVPWFADLKDEDFIELTPDEIVLVEEDHLEANFKWLDFKELNRRTELNIAVRKLENGKYALVSGIKNFIAGKVFNKNYRAYITDLEREEFVIKFEIKDDRKIQELRHLKSLKEEKIRQHEEDESISRELKGLSAPKGIVDKYFKFKEE